MAGEGSGGATGQLYKQDLARLVSALLLDIILIHTLCFKDILHLVLYVPISQVASVHINISTGCTYLGLAGVECQHVKQLP
jgi:hypothetical protein